MTPWERVAYDLGQTARVAWFLGHALLAERLTPPLLDPEEVPDNLPERAAHLRELMALLARDRANIAAGHYRLPDDLVGNPLAAWRQSRRFLADFGRVNLRRQRRRHQELHRGATQRYPRYYLQNFHYQSDGYLSAESAELYDFQVEVLFNGAADAMRRQALVALGQRLKGCDLRRERLLDVACGTGRFLRIVKQNYPRLPVTGVDLSRAYLDKARRDLQPWSWVELIEAAAEQLPFPDGQFTLVTNVYLFHELPRAVRRRAASEMARVLQPGGRLVLVDSLQLGDQKACDGLLELFPRLYHEPYFADYVREDLAGLFAAVGLQRVDEELAFLSKVVTFAKPAP